MAGIRDIAKKAGTSVSAVSRALNNTGYVSQELRKRVEAAARELDYQPHAGARSLRSGRSRLIGVLLPSLEVDFFARLAHRVEQRLFAAGYQALICSTAESRKHEAAYLRTLASNQIDGLMIAAVGGGGDTLGAMPGWNIPIVAVDRHLTDVAASSVGADHRKGGVLAAQHILDLGHRRVSVVGAPEHSEPIQLRGLGIVDAFASHGLDRPQAVFGVEHNVDACEALAIDALSTSPRPTAVLATTDVAAIGTMRAARRIGLSLPDELSVIGFDDLPAARFVWPELTTIRQPIDEIAKQAVEILVTRLKGDENGTPRDVRLPVELVVRGSTAKVPTPR